jgi:hypothetical protein
MDAIEIFLQNLKLYAAGACSLMKVQSTFENLDNFHDFWHYISDEDIRAKDAKYAEMQNKELEHFITAIENKDYAKANNITFLSSSSV